MSRNVNMLTKQENRINKLMQEVYDGKYEIDGLPCEAFELVGERQSAYFSHARENMKTDFAHVIMRDN